MIASAPTAGGYPSPHWGPDRKPAAVSFTFDNLGEAAELELGLWPSDVPVGEHYSARQVVPALLRRLPDLEATFFIEAWNCDMYPAAIESLAGHGHEIGLHGWRHEVWKQLDEPRQRSIIARSAAAMRAMGIEPRGFRPPGGQGSAFVHHVMREEGLRYISDVGEAPGVEDEIIRLPFRWRGVDGVFLDPSLGAAVGVGGAEDAGLEGMMRSHRRAIETAKHEGGHVIFVFHPFLIGRDPANMEALVDLVASVQADDAIWTAPCGKVAGWIESAVAREGVLL